ncbi:hypothetical protein PACTADRAFT_17291 [Pachysolen tannophilus NRRL Y-2460]|uniref:1,3-beta-glucanosyltransferase n=1 Tax=Pachysolen tannophilus NRRL Y-2460 TaxID=669874 RepID=A0A1E4TSA3_PACTA|nr:hypothetical protein PACTADRAFT_17291 [Pachysolen tannophilus NRRL Y-2460]
MKFINSIKLLALFAGGEIAQCAISNGNIGIGHQASIQDSQFGLTNSLNPVLKAPNAYSHIAPIEVYGIAYQPDFNHYHHAGKAEDKKGYIDPLAYSEICSRDIEYLKELNVNVIRVYAIDPQANHDYCMNLLAKNNIYLIADLSEPKASVDRKEPTWDGDLYDRYKNVVDALEKYNNVLGFFAGNEVVNDRTTTSAAPFVRASIRDVKKHIVKKKYRNIPIGYSTNDDSQIRDFLSNYFICGDDNTSKADFYGINNYEWCGHSTFRTSGYSERVADFKNFPIPVFFSEFGCNTVRPRPFTEVDALFSPLMSDAFSGGIMYMYFEEQNQFGVVEIVDSKNLSSPVKKLEDFKFLQYEYGKVNIKGVHREDYKPSATGNVSCKEQTENWKASTVLPNTPDQFKCDCLLSALSCTKAPIATITLEERKDLYGKICSANESETLPCAKISGNGTTGKYGIFSGCRQSQRLSFALNEYFMRNNQGMTYCDFENKAIIVNSRNSIEDLKAINEPNSSIRRTCFDAIGEEYISAIYGEFKANEKTDETESISPSTETAIMRSGATRITVARSKKISDGIINSIATIMVVAFAVLAFTSIFK